MSVVPLSVEKTSVVIADDNLFMCEMISNYLQSQSDIELAGIAHDGLEAVEKIKRHRPDAVLLDCAMPKLDGLEVLEILSQDSAKPPICIMVSGIGDDAVTKKATELGAKCCLIKPFELDLLVNRIRMFAPGKNVPEK